MMIKIIIYGFLSIYNSYLKKDRIKKLIKNILGKREIIVGFNDFRIYASNASAIESSIIFNDYTEQIVLDLIKKYALKGYNFIDVGANIGIHSLTAAISNKQIEIYSFEPEPTNFLRFIKNIGLNHIENIRPFRMGLGKTIGNTVLNVNKGWNKGKHSIKVQFDENYNEKLNIPVTQLNTFKYNIVGNNFIVKIDVEGFEKEVIEGANEVFTLFDNCILIIELVQEINEQGICSEITAFLKETGFDFVYKIINQKDFKSTQNYDGSGDYVFIKGKDAISIFQNS